jgi:hypothetical protein
MFPDLIDSLLRPSSYRRFALESGRRATGYVAFLAAIYLGAFGFATRLRVAPEMNRTFAWLETSMPKLRIASGKVIADPPGPTRIEHPIYKEVALEIDTTRTDPVTPKMLEDLKVRAYLTSNALYIENDGRVDPIDLSKSGGERPLVVDADSYREMERAFDWVFYPAVLLLAYLVFSAWIAAFGLAYALAGMIMASLAGGKLGYGALLRLALHAQTAGALLYSLDTTLPFQIPGLVVATPLLSLAYLWFGIRASSSPEADSAAAAPPAA